MAETSGEHGSAATLELALERRFRHPELALDWLRPWLSGLVLALCPEAQSLAVRLTGDRAMRRLQRTYRGVDTTTDVLSFPGEATVEGYHLGDIVISVPAALRQARAHGHDLRREVQILLLHGVLHCLGYDHETDDGTMEAKEEELRRRFVE